MPVAQVMVVPDKFHRRKEVNLKNYVGGGLLLLTFS